MTMSIAADLIVAFLLAATIGYCAVLNRRLGTLRTANGEMRQLVGEFDRAIGEARSGIAELKLAGAAADSNLQERIHQARGLVDELTYLADRADRAAERLAAGAAPAPARAPERVPGDHAERGLRSEAERELAEALRRAR